MTERAPTTHPPSAEHKAARRRVIVWLRLWRWTFRLSFGLLVLVTTVLTAGRLLMPLIDHYEAEIEQQLEAMLGADVAIEQLQGDWFRLGPIININGLRILNADNPQASHVIGALSIKPDVVASLLNRRLVIQQVVVLEPVIDLRQAANGSWSLAGLSGGAGGDYGDAIMDFLLTTGRMQITEAELALQWADGRHLDLDNVFLDLSNAGAEHTVQVQGRIAGQPSPFQLQSRFTGDPRLGVTGSAFLHANQLEFGDLLDLAPLQLDRAEISGDFWVSMAADDTLAVQAALDDVSLHGTGVDGGDLGRLALDNASLSLALRHSAGGRWQAWLDDAEFDWMNRPWDADGLYLDYRDEGDSRPLAVSAAQLDVGMVRDVVDDLLVLPEQAAGALVDLSPEGRLANLVVTTDLNGDFDNGFLLRGNLEDVAVGAWQGAPAGRGIQGYVQADNHSGTVELASHDFEIHLPDLFDDVWQYDSATSRVHWNIEDGLVHVNSSVIDVQNDFIHGHVQFDLDHWRDGNGDIQGELTLLIGVLDFDASRKSLYLPRLANIQGTMDWLDEALLGGQVSGSGFVSRTRVTPGASPEDNTVLTFYNVTGGELKFLPEWPALTGIDAFVDVDNNDVDVSAERGMIEGIPLAATEATVRPDPAGGSLLTLTGSADTSTALGMAFLRNTPVRNNIGDFIDNWQGEGKVHVDISLGVPLNAPDRQTDVLVDVTSDRSTLTIPEYSLAITDLRGKVNYDSGKGLSASGLSGKLFDFPIAATIESQTDDEDGAITGTRIVGSGRASRNALQAWQGQPQFVRDVLNFAGGEIDYLAQITIPVAGEDGNNRTSLRLSSELLGLSLDLPHPFAKTVEQIRPLDVLIDFAGDEEWISARFDNRVATNLRIRDNAFAGGNVVLGPEARDSAFGPVVLDEPGLVFSGHVDRFDYEAWENTALRFQELSAANGEPGSTLAELVSLVDVDVGRLSIVGQELENVRTRILRAGGLDSDSEAGDGTAADSWLVSLENDLLSGAFLFPDDESRPWEIDLDYLRFPEEEEPEDPNAEEVDILADIIPGDLPDMDFRTDEFDIGSKELGAWEFQLRASGDTATISNLVMTTPDARIRDFADESGANLDWRFENGVHTSSFTGLFHAGDLAKVLPGWGYDANVESKEASFISNLQWNGSPAAFGLEKAVGNVVMNIRDGRFVDVDSGGSRLFGALNFDSLVRRLQLDFSDLYEKGLAYDDINGRLEFDKGIVTTDGPFVIAGPSSRISINGEINLLNETIDADMQVNVPISQNLSVLAGLLGAWPIAVSTYLASKIFEDQVDDFTTVLYRLEGPWENPTSGFEPSEEILEAAENDPEAAPADEPAADPETAAEGSAP